MMVGRPLPPTLLFDYPSVQALSDHLSRELVPEEFIKPQEASEEDASSQKIDNLSEAEIATLLSDKLTALESSDQT